MRIGYIGSAWGTSLQRARALERLGHSVSIVDPWPWVARRPLLARLHYHSGYLAVDRLLCSKLAQEARATGPELIWVNQCEYLGPLSLRALRELAVPIVNYANDNPFCAPSRIRFRNYRAALPYYDLVVVVFADAVEAAKRAGARRVIRKFISADELAHLRQPEVDAPDSRYSSDVAFVGTYMRAQRGEFIAELIRRHVPLSIWGDHWHKSKEWAIIRPHWRGPGVYDERGYAQIIRSAKICLGLLNKAAGNLHTGRSIQIPALGALFCGERTIEHLTLYRDGEEAVFWKDAAECAAVCSSLLNDDERRRQIAQRGHERALRNNLFNEPVLASILKEIF